MMKKCILCEEDTVEQNIKLHPNEFVMMVSNQNEKKTAIAKFVDYLHPLQPSQHLLMISLGASSQKIRSKSVDLIY